MRRVTFEILPTIDGFEVVAADTGRAVVSVFDRHVAEASKNALNKASLGGPKALVKAIAKL